MDYNKPGDRIDISVCCGSGGTSSVTCYLGYDGSQCGDDEQYDESVWESDCGSGSDGSYYCYYWCLSYDVYKIGVWLK